ncbi:phage tail tape measure protein [Deinococcus wulumuqiensis]|uniref:phage tail tape measure protein n=1 Tax=Deinococcus wulumuqiensis TaxID=980427 RepID=UPI000347652B|nr:phage tail tape measure protein [Deinococcus wulumuqiensis]
MSEVAEYAKKNGTLALTLKLSGTSLQAAKQQIDAAVGGRNLPFTVTFDPVSVNAAVAGLRSTLNSVVGINTSGLTAVQTQISAQIAEMTRLIAELRALGSGGGTSSGRGALGGLSANAQNLLSQLQLLNNEYKRGDVDALAYASRLAGLQSALRVAAAGATAGSTEFQRLDRAVTQTVQGLRNVQSAEITKLRTELSGARAQFDAAAAAATTLAQRRAAIAAYEGDLIRIRVALQGMAAAGRLTEQQLGQVNRMLAQTARESNTIRGGVNIAGLSGNVSNALQQLMTYVPGMSQLNGVLGNTPPLLMGVVGGLAALTAGMAASFRTAAEFQQKMADINALTQPTAEGLAQMSEFAKDFGIPLGIGARQAADAMLSLSKAGLSTADIMGGGLASALNLAAAAGISTAQAGELAVTAMTAFGMAAKDLPQIANIYAGFANQTTQDAEALGRALAAVGPVAKSAGLNFAQLSGYMAMLAKGGFARMDDAGTSFKTMLLSLQSPSTTAAKAMAQIGLNAYDAAGNFRPLGETLQELRERLAGLSEQQRNNVLKNMFGTDGIRAAQILYQATGEEIANVTDKIATQGNAAEVAKTRLETYQGSVDKMKANFEALRIELGEKFLPAATRAVEFFDRGVTSLRDMANNTNTLLGYVIPLGAAMLALTAPQIIAGLAAITAGIQGAAAASMAWALANPFGVIAVGLSALAVSVNKIYSDTRRIYEGVDKANQDSHDKLMARVQALRAEGTELAKAQADYLEALDARSKAQEGKVTGKTIWGERLVTVDADEVARTGKEVERLFEKVKELRAESAPKGSPEKTTTDATGIDPQVVQRQSVALESLRNAIAGRMDALDADMPPKLESKLAKISNEYKKLGKDLKEAFGGNLNNTEYLKGVAELEAARQKEISAARRKWAADEAKKAAEEVQKGTDAVAKAQLAGERQRIEAMQDGLAKRQALRDLEIRQAQADTARSLEGVKDPKARAKLEEAGRIEVLTIQRQYDAEELRLSREAAQKSRELLTKAQFDTEKARVDAMQEGVAKRQSLRDLELRHIESETQRSLQGVSDPTLRAALVQQSREAALRVQQRYSAEEIRLAQESAQKVRDVQVQMQLDGERARIEAMQDGLAKRQAIRDLELREAAQRTQDSLKGVTDPRLRAALEESGRQAALLVNQRYDAQEARLAQESAKRLRDILDKGQHDAEQARINRMQEGSAKRAAQRGLDYRDLQKSIQDEVDALAGDPRAQAARLQAGRQELNNLRRQWAAEDRQREVEDARAAADLSLQTLRSRQAAEVAAMQDGSAKRAAQRKLDIQGVRDDVAQQLRDAADQPKKQAEIIAAGNERIRQINANFRKGEQDAAREHARKLLDIAVQQLQDQENLAQAQRGEALAQFDLDAGRQLAAFKGTAQERIRYEAQVAQQRAQLVERQAREAVAAQRRQLALERDQALSADNLSASDRQRIWERYRTQLSTLEAKAHSEALQRLSEREQREQEAAQRIHEANVKAALKPVEDGKKGIDELNFQLSLAETASERLALETQIGQAHQQQVAVLQRLLADANKMNLTEEERTQLAEQLTTAQRAVQTSAATVLKTQQDVTRELAEQQDKMRQLSERYGEIQGLLGGGTTGVVKAQEDLTASTGKLSDAYAEALPYLRQIREQSLTPADYDDATKALDKFVAALGDQKAKLEALRTEYDRQRDAIKSVQDVLSGFGRDLGDQNLLEGAITVNQSTYDQAKNALDTLLKGGKYDAVQLAEATKRLQDSYGGLKDALAALGEARAREFEKERDRIKNESDTRTRALDAQIKAAKDAGLDTTALERERDRLVSETDRRVRELEGKAEAARKGAQDALSDRTKGLGDLLQGVAQGAGKAQKSVDDLAGQVAQAEKDVAASAARMRQDLGGMFKGLPAQAGKAGQQAGQQFMAQLQAQLKKVKLPSVTVGGANLPAAMRGAGNVSITQTFYWNGQQVTGPASPNTKSLLRMLANEADAECRRRNS